MANKNSYHLSVHHYRPTPTPKDAYEPYALETDEGFETVLAFIKKHDEWAATYIPKGYTDFNNEPLTKWPNFSKTLQKASRAYPKWRITLTVHEGDNEEQLHHWVAGKTYIAKPVLLFPGFDSGLLK